MTTASTHAPTELTEKFAETHAAKAGFSTMEKSVLAALAMLPLSSLLMFTDGLRFFS